MSDPSDDWECKFDASPILEQTRASIDMNAIYMPSGHSRSDEGQKVFSFPCGPSLSEEEDEVTESKIKAFLDEKVGLLFQTKWVILQSSVTLTLSILNFYINNYMIGSRTEETADTFI